MNFLGTKKSLLIISLLMLLGVFFVLSLVYQKQRGLEVVFLDVGQGDAILITTVSGKNILIDGGAYLDIDHNISMSKNIFCPLAVIRSSSERRVPYNRPGYTSSHSIKSSA